jgi:hypothetical protein
MKPKSLTKASSGLVGALAIASGSTAYSDIVVVGTPADLLPSTFPTSTSIFTDWDINGDAIADFTFSFRQPEAATVDWQGNIFSYSAGNAVLAYLGPFFPYVTRLNNGDTVAPFGPNAFVPGSAGGVQVIISSRYAGTDYGQFHPPNSTGFLGFQFTVGSDTFNGYIQFRIARDFGIDFISAAYNDTPGGAITAGAIPEPGTVGLLALGAAGLAGVAIRRRKKNQPA